MKNKTLFVTCTAILILTLKINASDRTLTEIQRIHIKANSNSIAEDEKKRKAFFEEEVNLDKKDFSDFLTNEFKQTPISPGSILFRILQYDPMKGIKWLNNSYDNIYQTVEGKHNFVVSIWKLKFVESNQIMALLLDDKTVIPHRGEHSSLKAMDDRVCDLVYTELNGSIYEASGEKETLFSPQNSIDIDTKHRIGNCIFEAKLRLLSVLRLVRICL